MSPAELSLVTGPQIIPEVGSDSVPTCVAYNGKLYAGWKGSSGDTRLWYSTFDGKVWSAQDSMPNGFVSSHGVSFATFRRALYAVFKGNNSDLWWTRFDGTSWQPLQRTGGMCSPLSPTLTVYRGALYLACKSDTPSWDLPDAIWWIPFDGQVWKDRPRSDNLTNESPALGVWGEGSDQKLLMVHKGNEADESLYYSMLDGYAWAPKQPIGGRTDAPPSLMYYRGYLYACWKEAGDDEHIMYSAFDGGSWIDPKRLPGEFEIGSGPSLAVFNEQLYILWRGWDNKLWWASAAPSGLQMTITEAKTEKTANRSEPPATPTAIIDHPNTSEAKPSYATTSDAKQTDAAATIPEVPQAVITPQLVSQPVIQQPAVPLSAPVEVSTSEPALHPTSDDGIATTTTGVPAAAAPRPASSSSSGSDDFRRLKRGIKKGLKKGVSEISDKFHGRFRGTAPK